MKFKNCSEVHHCSFNVVVKYRVFQKSSAHFDNECLGNYLEYKSTSGKFRKLVIKFFYMECSKMFNVSTIGYTTHIKPIVQFLPNAFQHCMVSGYNNSCYSCLQLIHVSRNRGHLDQSFHK